MQDDSHNPLSHDPLFSVIIATYKRPTLLPRAVQSVLAQTFTDFELIIIDDASPDETPEVVAKFDDPRIRTVRRAVNGGCPAAKNTGIQMARGKYVALLDDDDEYLPEFLAETAKTLEASPDSVGISWCGTRIIKDTPEGPVVVKEGIWQPTYKNREDAFLSIIRTRQVGANCGLTFRRSSLLAVGMFDELLRKADDTDLIIRVMQRYDFVVVPKILITIHHHTNGRLTTYDNTMAQAYERIIAKNLDTLEAHPDLWAEKHYKTAWLYYHGNNKSKAREHVRLALRAKPLQPRIWFTWLLLETFGEAGPAIHRQLSSWKAQVVG